MKKMISVLLSLSMLSCLFSVSAAAEDAPVTLTVNGKPVVCDVPPQIVDDRTLVPMRAAFEALDAALLWDESTSTVHAQTAEGTIVSLQIGSDKLFVPGGVVTLDVPARIIGDRTMVPIRAIAESLKCDVQWIPDTREVAITKIAVLRKS